MSTSTMRTAVLQATAIFTVSMIVGHHLSTGIFDGVQSDGGYLNMTAALNSTMSRPWTNQTLATGNFTKGALSLNHSKNITNGTTLHDILGVDQIPADSFYSRALPREIVMFLVLAVLRHRWYIWLERILPARPKQRHASYQGTEKVEESEDREQEVINKWIAQGRVHRASLSWCNTFLKWFLEMTVGKLLCYTLEHILEMALEMKTLSSFLPGLKTYVAISYITSFLSATPLAMLVVFITTPAHKQIVFMAGADLVTTIFLTTIVRVFAAWLIKTKFAQSVMQGIAQEARKLELNISRDEL